MSLIKRPTVIESVFGSNARHFLSDPAINGRYLTGTGGGVTQTLGCQSDTGVVSELHPKKNKLTKTNNYKTISQKACR